MMTNDSRLDSHLDLNEVCNTLSHETFFFQMQGDAMEEMGIFSGDRLVVERKRRPKNGDIILLYFDGEWIVRPYKSTSTMKHCLVLSLEHAQEIDLTTTNLSTNYFGVVTSIVRTF